MNNNENNNIENQTLQPSMNNQQPMGPQNSTNIMDSQPQLNTFNNNGVSSNINNPQPQMTPLQNTISNNQQPTSNTSIPNTNINSNNIQTQQNNAPINDKKDNKSKIIIVIAIVALIGVVFFLTRNGAGVSGSKEVIAKAGEKITIDNEEDKFTLKVTSSPEKYQSNTGSNTIRVNVSVENLKNSDLITSTYVISLTDSNKNEIYKGTSINFGNYGLSTLESNSSEEGYVSLYTNLNDEYKYETDYTKMDNIKYLRINKISYNTTNYYIELN